MLKKIKELFIPQQLLKGNCGIEREMLRVDKNGYLSFTDHPEIFGDKVLNPYITTDFSESQVRQFELDRTHVDWGGCSYSFVNP